MTKKELLSKELLAAKQKLIDDGFEIDLEKPLKDNLSSLKKYEIAFQEVIENIWPEEPWWKVTNYWDIFQDLLITGDVDEVINDIISNISEEKLKEPVDETLEEAMKLKELPAVKEMQKDPEFANLNSSELATIVKMVADDTDLDLQKISVDDIKDYVEIGGGWAEFIFNFYDSRRPTLTQNMYVQLAKKDPHLMEVIREFADENRLLEPIYTDVDGIKKTDDNYVKLVLDVGLSPKDMEATINELKYRYY